MKANSSAPKLEQANEVQALRIIPKEQTTEVDVNEVKQAEEAKPIEAIKLLTIEEIKRKNEVLRRLTAKYDLLQDKRQRVENFAISHDQDTASVTVSDATGEVFESNSPKTISKLIEFWKEEFNTALSDVEREIRENA